MKTNDNQFEDHATLVGTDDDIEIVVEVQSAALDVTHYADCDEYEVMDTDWVAFSAEGEDLSADLDDADRQRINWAAEQFVSDTPGLDW